MSRDHLEQNHIWVYAVGLLLGPGRLAMGALIAAAEEAGYCKLLARVFPENAASRGLLTSLGFREVGTYEKYARLGGGWRDVVIVERLIPVNLVPTEASSKDSLEGAA